MLKKYIYLSIVILLCFCSLNLSAMKRSASAPLDSPRNKMSVDAVLHFKEDLRKIIESDDCFYYNSELVNLFNNEEVWSIIESDFVDEILGKAAHKNKMSVLASLCFAGEKFWGKVTPRGAKNAVFKAALTNQAYVVKALLGYQRIY